LEHRERRGKSPLQAGGTRTTSVNQGKRNPLKDGIESTRKKGRGRFAIKLQLRGGAVFYKCKREKARGNGSHEKKNSER